MARILPGRRLQRDHRTLARSVAAPLHGVPRRLLHLGIDGGRHVAAARVAAGEEVGQPTAEQPLVGAVEDGVLGALQPGARIPQRVEAGDGRVCQGVGIDPQEPEAAVGRHRVRQQLAARRDLTALPRVLVEQHSLVARVGAKTVGGEDLRQRGVGQQQHDQHHDHDRDAAQRGVHTRSITSVLAAAIDEVSGGRVMSGRRAACEMRIRIASST